MTSMKRERWHQIEEVFHRVLAAGTEDRARVLDEACADDADLRRQVSALVEGAAEGSGSIRRVLAAGWLARCCGRT